MEMRRVGEKEGDERQDGEWTLSGCCNPRKLMLFAGENEVLLIRRQKT